MSAAIRSMTGYSRASVSNDAYTVAVEIRSVNHRYLDLRVRGSSSVAALEKRMRDLIAAGLSRGKVDVSVHLKPKGESAFEIEVDRPLMKDFVRIATEIGEETDVDTNLSVSSLVGFTPAFQVRERDLSERSTLWEVLEAALVKALEDLASMRVAEGAEMLADLKGRVESLAESLTRIESLSESGRAARREQLEARVQELLGSAVEPPAVAMEVARLVERSDIAEEITRFRSHLELWNSTIAAGGGCGKKLDFIIQEMNREVNTIGSKCQDGKITEQVIAMKSELERVREQVQNIE